ncbi:MAG: molybdopterin-dependent oxidoreductase [Deltaproteobacteria bacterium]|nr:molybdopterin-dependent oxidoreductase [Deltaproteobacteria bacterium]
MKGEELIPTMCHGCSYGGYNCGMLAHVKDGRFIKVEGNPYHPLNRGRLCAKGHSAVQWVYNDQRLRYPLVRAGNKGEGKFRRVSWDEALDIIVSNIKEIKEQYGPEYLMFSKGQSSSWLGLHQFLWVRFMHALGSTTFTNWGPSVCYAPQLLYHRQVIGGSTYTRPDYDNADLIIEWFTGGGTGGPARGGVETLNTNLRSVPIKIIERIKRGARLIIINPQLIPLGANGRAHKWIPIRPGTDAALALAMINVIVRERIYDRSFVLKWCEGFENLETHVQQYSPEWAQEITDIPAEDIKQLARAYVTTKRACIRISEAPQKKDLRSLAMAIPILMAITGHLDRPGGNAWFFPAGRLGFDTLPDRISERAKERLLGGDRFYIRSKGRKGAYFRSVIQALITGEPYRPRGILIFGSNPLSTARNPVLIAEALKMLQFVLVVDVVPTPTSRYADVILPAATRYECYGQPGLWENHLTMSHKVIDPLWESRDELEVTLELACRLGMGGDFWNGDYQRMVNDFLSPVGISVDQLKSNALKGILLPRTEWMDRRERYKEVFRDLPNGKIQLYNEILEKQGLEPLPTYHGEFDDLPDIGKHNEKYPLMFTDEHSDYISHHAWMRHIPWLREIDRYPHVKINPATASRYRIQDGDWVDIISPDGKMKAVARIFAGMRPGTLIGQHGWWQGCGPLGLSESSPLDGGTNPNCLYNWDKQDPITGDITKNVFVRVERGVPPEGVPPLQEVT